MQIGIEVDEVDPHIEFHARLCRRAHEALTMALSLGDGGVEIARGVEHPVRAVGEAASLGVEVSEGGHNEAGAGARSEEHTSELQSLMRISYAVFCLKKKKN